MTTLSLARDERLDHGACRLTMRVRQHHAQTDARIGEQLVQPVLLAGELATEFLSVPCNVTQTSQVRVPS